jgi:hypothetical protein
MAVVDLRTLESLALGVRNFFQVGEEAQVARRMRVAKQVVVLGARDEQHAFAYARPGLGLEPAMVAKHDDVDAGRLGGAEHLGARALSVVRVLRVDVQNGAVIVVDAALRYGLALACELEPCLVHRCQVRFRKAFDRGVFAAGAGVIRQKCASRQNSHQKTFEHVRSSSTG